MIICGVAMIAAMFFAGFFALHKTIGKLPLVFKLLSIDVAHFHLSLILIWLDYN